MNLTQPLSILLLALVLAGCASPVPVGRNFPVSDQYKVRATHHWDVIAGDVAEQTALSLTERDWLAGRTLHVESPHPGIAFQQGFCNFMITQLVNRGLPVVEAPQGALIVSYETQVVRHASPRPGFAPGGLTALTAGVMVGRNLILGTPSPWVAGGVLLGTTAAMDLAANQLTRPTQTELIVTTSITDNGRFMLRKNDVYYVEDLDISLFVAPPPPPQPTPPMPTKVLEVIGQ